MCEEIVELAAMLKKSVVTLASWRRRSRGPKWIAVGGDIRYRAKDVEAWLKQREMRRLA